MNTPRKPRSSSETWLLVEIGCYTILLALIFVVVLGVIAAVVS